MTKITIPDNWQWPGSPVDTVQTETRIHLGNDPATVAKMLARAMVRTYGKDIAALILLGAAEEALG